MNAFATGPFVCECVRGVNCRLALEAADLYKQGYATLVVLTEELSDGAIEELARRGIMVPTDAEVARDVMIRLGMPKISPVCMASFVTMNRSRAVRLVERLAAQDRHSVSGLPVWRER